MVEFTRGWHDIHPVPAFNYQLNRWLPLADATEFGRAGQRVSSVADWKREMLTLAERAVREGRLLHASTYYRAAEFFMAANDPDKAAAYDAYREHFYRAAGGIEFERLDVPFGGGELPALRFNAQGQPWDTLVLHGGFDSYMEEFVYWAADFAAAGYDVILFEGPGQGAALRLHGLTMTPEWELPMRAVLDAFAVTSCSLIGLSLGGYLAPRAAAFEARIKRVVAINILFDFFDCFASLMPRTLVETITRLHDTSDRVGLNDVMGRLIAEQPAFAWPIDHGMHTSGSETYFDFIAWLRAMNTREFSSRLTQDVLITAGTHDHIVPLHQFHQQMQALTNARSVTARLFTAAETGQHHCQVGNLRLLLDVVQNWLDVQIKHRD